MASATPIIPSSGNFPVALSPGLFQSTNKKRKRSEQDLLALRYAFKPASMTSITEASIIPSENGSKILQADTTSHGAQIFDVREEQSKMRECVLVYDEATHSFTLHPLGMTAHLTLNRSASSTTTRPSTSHSETSSTSSTSQPLAQIAPPIEESSDTMRPKRPRPSEVVLPAAPATAPARPTKGGKGLPRKTTLPVHAPIPSLGAPAKSTAKGRGKAGAKKNLPTKRTKKAPPTPQGKYKSAEIIEDSEEEYDLGETAGTGGGAGEEDDEDEFAKMVGESMAGGEVEEDEEEDDDDDEDEEEDDDDELGGARLAVRRDANPGGNGESEWL